MLIAVQYLIVRSVGNLLKEGIMQDSLRGLVTNILGGDRFEIRVLDTGAFNEHKYKAAQCIRIAGINDPDLYPGKPDGGRMEKLKNKEVLCYILARDADGNAVAVVHCIN